MTYNFTYVPQGFFFCSSVFDTGSIVFGFYSVTDSRVIASVTRNLGLQGNFGRLFEAVLCNLGFANTPDSLHWEKFNALDLAQGIADEYASGQATNERALLYLASVALSRLGYSAFGGVRTLCESAGGVRGPVQYAITNATPSRLTLSDRSGAQQEVTSSGCHDIAILTGILNDLYPNFYQPTDDVVTGAAFESLPNVSSWSAYGEVSVPRFCAPLRAKEHSDGEAEVIIAACWNGRTAWSWSSQHWYMSSAWFTTNACALALIAQVPTHEPLALWFEFKDIRELGQHIKSDVLGLADGLVTIREGVQGLNSLCSEQFVIMQENHTAISRDVGGVMTAEQNLSQQLSSHDDRAELIKAKVDSTNGIVNQMSVEMTHDRQTLVQTRDTVAQIVNLVQTQSRELSAQVEHLLAIKRAQRLNDSVLGMMLLKLVLTKVKRKQRDQLIAKIGELAYTDAPEADKADDVTGVIGLFDSFFTTDGSLVADSNI